MWDTGTLNTPVPTTEEPRHNVQQNMSHTVKESPEHIHADSVQSRERRPFHAVNKRVQGVISYSVQELRISRFTGVGPGLWSNYDLALKSPYVGSVSADTVDRVGTSFLERVRLCCLREGAHIEHMLK